MQEMQAVDEDRLWVVRMCSRIQHAHRTESKKTSGLRCVVGYRKGCRGLMGWRGDGASLPVKGNSGHFLKFYQNILTMHWKCYTVVFFTLFTTRAIHNHNHNFDHHDHLWEGDLAWMGQLFLAPSTSWKLCSHKTLLHCALCSMHCFMHYVMHCFMHWRSTLICYTLLLCTAVCMYCNVHPAPLEG